MKLKKQKQKKITRAIYRQIYLRQNILKYSSATENGEFLVGPTLLLVIIFLEQNGADILTTFERLSTNYPVVTYTIYVFFTYI